jgi:hypothetical protein
VLFLVSTDSPVPQCAKSGANEYWPQTVLAHIAQNATELTGNHANRTPAPSSEAGVRNAPSTLTTDGQVDGRRRSVPVADTVNLRRTLKNCALWEAVNVKLLLNRLTQLMQITHNH